MAINFKPEGYATLTPFVVAKDAASFLTFLKDVLEGEVSEKMMTPDGKVMHAEVQIGDSRIMVAEEQGEWKASPAMLYMYVKDVDAAYARAVRAGATPMGGPQDEFYGDRSGAIKDIWGNTWCLATHIEDIAPEEMKRRANEFVNSHATA